MPNDHVGSANLLAIESTLSEETPFGNYGYIAGKVTAAYVQLLTLVAEKAPAAKLLLAKLDRVDDKCRRVMFRDPLVRRTIEDGVGATVRGLDTIEPAVLDELLAAAAEAGAVSQTLLDQTVECIPFNYPSGQAGYIWADEQPSTLPGMRFRGEVLKRLPGLRVEIPTHDQVESIIAGSRLAHRIAPRPAGSAMSHAFMVIVGTFNDQENQFNAVTTPGLPGIVIMSPRSLANIASAAETLFHESMHLKFLDIDYIHPLFVLGFRPESSPRITPIWHQGGRGQGDWPVDRLLTSMHVYLSLAVLFEKAKVRGGEDLYGSDHCVARAEECKTRATWLFEEAQNHLEFLTDSGREFVASIGVMLRDLRAL